MVVASVKSYYGKGPKEIRMTNVDLKLFKKSYQAISNAFLSVE